MADLTITATSVVKGSSAVTSDGSEVFGETVTAGMPVYKNTSGDGKIYKTKSDSATHAKAIGIALLGGAINQPAFYQTAGTIAIGATTAAGTPYFVSTNFGGIAPVGDLGAGNIVTLLGFGDGSGNIVMNVLATGITHA